MALSSFLLRLPPVCVLLLCLPTPGQSMVGPVVPEVPFVAIWNAGTDFCQKNFQVSIDLDAFHIVANPGQAFRGPNMTIFYSTQLGTYPSYTSEGQPVNGGLPQNASLAAHLAKAQQDILDFIPKPDFRGLAVIDWESWRPLWAYNWDSKNIYRQRSLELIRKKHPDWKSWRVESEAIAQFEGAAKAWMLDTLKRGETLRPDGLWGYYGFPDCYNYNFESPSYTGQCPPDLEAQNDHLWWMWEESRALYPSIYLSAKLAGNGHSLLYVRARLREAFRVAAGTRCPGRHILPYAQILYENTEHFLPLEELEQSIGESAAQGTDGIVLWISWENYKSKESCQAIKDYMDTTLGPFLLNVTSSTRLCSQALCSGHGRCARRPDHSHAFLFLSPSSFSIRRQPVSGHLVVEGSLTEEARDKMAMEFECQCYSGWGGEHCERQDD
ncbi:hyaluronidase-1 [Monodelphis domestica]|uniref:hyaluronidase-1 n=1 Tax=Monodelphis domestica TaxID=13616 RepID=UPI0024E1C32C|nr:hyaluronidase-1 [Monodelphis domestica]